MTHLAGTRRRALRRVLAATVAAACCAALAACGGEEQPQTSTVSVQGTEPDSLIPGKTTALSGIRIAKTLFTGLVAFEPKTGKPVNMMAESITSPDNVVWTIKVKKGWLFHNGEKVTARSYVDAWNALAYGPNAFVNTAYMENVVGYEDVAPDDGKPTAKTLKGLRAVDDHTIRVTLKKPYNRFPTILGHHSTAPLPKVAFDDLKAFEEHPIGNGPYRMAEDWQHDRKITLKKYGKYTGSNTGSFETIEVPIYSDEQTAFNDFKGGNLDVVTVPPNQYESAKAEFGDRYISAPISMFSRMDFPLYDKRFDDVNLRRAFSMAIDRKQIIDTIFDGQFVPATSIVPRTVPDHQADPCGTYCTYDPAEAKRLLAKAGGWQGTLIIWNDSGGSNDDWVEAIANNLRTNLGIKDIQFKRIPFAEYLQAQRDRKMTGIFRNSWLTDSGALEQSIEPLVVPGAPGHRTGYDNPKVTAAIEDGKQAPTTKEATAFYHRAEDLVLADLPTIPLWFNKAQVVHSEDVGNVTVDSLSNVRLELLKPAA